MDYSRYWHLGIAPATRLDGERDGMYRLQAEVEAAYEREEALSQQSRFDEMPTTKGEDDGTTE